jgi:hypothetical protein
MARRSFKPCPLNPPLSAAQRERIEARMVGFWMPHFREYWDYDRVHEMARKFMAAKDRRPRAQRMREIAEDYTT